MAKYRKYGSMSRMDIYCEIERKNANLRLHPDVKKYCFKNNARYDPKFFNFSGKDKCSGPEPRPEDRKSPDPIKEESEIEPEINFVGVRIPRSFN